MIYIRKLHRERLTYAHLDRVSYVASSTCRTFFARKTNQSCMYRLLSDRECLEIPDLPERGAYRDSCRTQLRRLAGAKLILV